MATTSALLQPLESRTLLSAGPDPIALTFGGQEITATAASADGRTGHLLLAGTLATGNDFAPGPAVLYMSPIGSDWSPFIARYTPDGQPLWVQTIPIDRAFADGGAIFPRISALAAGPDGSVYAAGRFSGSIDFDRSTDRDSRGLPDHTLTTAPAADGDRAHATDVFLIKYDRAGKYLWGMLINNVTTGVENVTGLAVDRFGSAYVAGTSHAIDPATGAAAPDTSFIARISTAGQLAWNTPLPAGISTVAIDHHDSPWAAVGGQALRLYQFNARGRVINQIGAAAADNSNGHGIGSITARSIAFDAHDNLILAGDFTRTFDLAPGKAKSLFGDKRYDRMGWSNIFLSKIRPAGDLVFAFAIGGIEADKAAGAGIDRATGDILLSGVYSGKVDFDPSRSAAATLDAGYDSVDGDYPSDIFTARYTPTGRFLHVKDHTTLDYDTPAGFAITPTFAFTASSNYDQKHDRRYINLFELQT